ncbi:MAG: hypothetical protein DRG83_16505 [Deltaproteobacteria bacterium]|nr:MAG: hypothetical protein DRG83_16505 [Deltaproteobacteria bacterium]
MQNAENNSSFIIHNSTLNSWRRRITRHCLYGVDLNPLAVNLAKLSLCLNCFASDHRLTFLDHHLRCGNSLIGIRSLTQLASIPERKKESKKKKNPQILLFDYNDLSSILAKAARGVASINQIDEDDTDSQKATLDEALDATTTLRPLADLYTAYLMDSDIQAGDYKDLFECLATGKPVENSLNPALSEILKSVEAYRDRHHFYHWPLEFPDIFGPDATGGFSATVGNPPWDVLQPNTQEFYVNYDPDFRKYKKQEALKVIKQLQERHPNIAERWKEYEVGFKEASAYCKEPEAYNCLQRGKIDLYKAFLERFFMILRNGGRMGIVVPSGIYTDQGCQPLREMFFNQSRIKFLYCFENRRAVFNIHRSFKFVLFGTQKGGKTDQFKCAFMEHDPERLPAIDANAFISSVNDVYQFSPQSVSFLELRNYKEVQIFRKLSANGHIGDRPGVRYTREFNLTTDRDLFVKIELAEYELYEGKHINQFDSGFEERTIGLLREQVYEVFSNHKGSIPPNQYRWALREIAASTNERTSISTILPKKACHTYTLCSLTARQCYKLFSETMSCEEMALLAMVGYANSFCFDFYIRRKITNHLSTPFYEFPVPPSNSQGIYSDIAARSARLICVTGNYSDLWNKVYSDGWKSRDLWYPPSAPIDNYGPIHEQEIRRRLRDEARNLTPEWGPHCGVHDRLPDRRDTGDRAQLRAEIDAYVAHLYGLSRDDFAYILDTFPVLKKKEEKAFGEFMSKRKCLEEYDRIEKILNAE